MLCDISFDSCHPMLTARAYLYHRGEQGSQAVAAAAADMLQLVLTGDRWQSRGVFWLMALMHARPYVRSQVCMEARASPKKYIYRQGYITPWRTLCASGDCDWQRICLGGDAKEEG